MEEISLNSSWSGTGFVPMRDLPDSDDEDGKTEQVKVVSIELK